MSSSRFNVWELRADNVWEDWERTLKDRQKMKITIKKKEQRVGLIRDEDDRYETPNSIQAILDHLNQTGISNRIKFFGAKEAEDKHLLAVHSENHVNLIKNISSPEFDSLRNDIASELDPLYSNQESSLSALKAVDAAIKMVKTVANGGLDSGVAVVRPPGHYAERNKAKGYCLFNNVAVAAAFLLDQRDLGVRRILIVDWDVHHGSGTQQIFWNDYRVLYFSVHRARNDSDTSSPDNDDGSYTMIGEGVGAGYTINVPLKGKCGDPDYFAVWDHILLPVAKDYNPDMIIVSAGFHAADGEPHGECHVITPNGYSILLKKLKNFAKGRIVMVLEGGYNLDFISKSMRACLEVLLEDRATIESSESDPLPLESTRTVIEAVRRELSLFWPTLARKLPQESLCPPPNTLASSSDSKAEDDKSPQDFLEKLLFKLRAKLGEKTTWRSELSEVYIWYASYGSSMWESRFHCYLSGEQEEGMLKKCSGSVDGTLPKGIMWKTFPCHMFFGHDLSFTWGRGGVALVNPKRNTEYNTYMCLYKITLEQFNDILSQKNFRIPKVDSPVFDETTLNAISDKEFNFEVVIECARYGNVVYLGKDEGISIITTTCSPFYLARFKAGELPSCHPNQAYRNAMVKGLVEGQKLSEADAIDYVEKAVTNSADIFHA